MSTTPNKDEALAAMHAAAQTRRLNRGGRRVSSAPREREQFPYWKAQYFDARVCAWKDVQEKHHDQGAAQAEGLKLKAKHGRARLMEVQRDGRTPLPEL